MLRPTSLALGFLVATSAWLGCSSTQDGAETGDDQNVTSTTCNIFNNQTGKRITAEELAKLNDPVALKILEGECPTTYTKVLEKLKKTDADGCNAGKDGLQSFLVSETAAFAKDDAEASQGGFRSVITRSCGGRRANEMMFSGFASGRGVGDTNVEMIGRDSATGVFNYYEVLDGGQWVFYGNSFDFIGNGYTCKDSGFCVANNSKKASSPSGKSCASCHVSGGLIMKELDSPWLHWTAGFAKGSNAIVSKNEDKLGKQNQGENLELQVVRPSFNDYNQKRVDFLASKGTQELLRPLFCTMDVNLASSLGSGSLVASEDLSFGFLQMDNNVYGELKKEVKQRIEGLPASVDDTNFAFTFPIRGRIDEDYQQKLVAAKLLDDEFVKDALAVDFTRPVFSGQRCGLLKSLDGKTAKLDEKLAQYAKEADKGKKDALAAEIAKEIPTTFAAALQGKSTPAEAKFRTNLTDDKANAAAHSKAADDFFTKCNARLSDAASKKDATKDMMTYASHLRRVMRKDVVGFNGQDLLEGRGRDDKMVTDDIPDNTNAFDPETCTLTLAPNAVK